MAGHQSRVFYLWALLLATGCCDKRYHRDVTLDENLSVVSRVNNHIGFSLLKQLSSSSSNLVFSPYSLMISLDMLMKGAKGDTAKVFRDFSGLEISESNIQNALRYLLMRLTRPSNNYTCNSANAILVRNYLHLLPAYKTQTQEIFDAKVMEVGFEKSKQAIKTINKWVNSKTKEQISRIVDVLKLDAILSAANFKGLWAKSFNASETRLRDFYNNGSSLQAKKVKTMRIIGRFHTTSLPNYDVLELPYAGEEISMWILLPKKNKSVADIEKDLSVETFRYWIMYRASMNTTNVELRLPRFRLESTVDLTKEFQDSGLKEIFKRNADFSGMVKTGRLNVRQIAQKAVIEIDGAGSEAPIISESFQNRVKANLCGSLSIVLLFLRSSKGKVNGFCSWDE